MKHTLRNWTAKQTGLGLDKHLAVTGTDVETGRPVRLSAIAMLVPRAPNVAAIDTDGMAHTLLLD